MKRTPIFAVILLILLALAGCEGAPAPENSGDVNPRSADVGTVAATDLPTGEVTEAPTDPPTVTDAPTPADPATDTPTARATAAPTVAPTSAATDTPAPEPTAPEPTATEPADPTATRPPTGTATAGPTVSPTDAPTDAPTAAPTVRPTSTRIPSAVFVRSHTSYSQGGRLVVVGELINGGQSDVFGPRVIGQFYDSGGNVIAAGQARASLSKLEIERPDPFRMTVDVDPSSVARYELRVVSEDVSIIELRELDVTVAEVSERNGEAAVVGELVNEHESALSSIVIAATFYDESGEVVEVVDTFLGGETVEPGSTLSFQIPLPTNDRAYTKMRVLAQGQLNVY